MGIWGDTGESYMVVSMNADVKFILYRRVKF